MDTKKLDQWAELLLDTGKRNPLINFRDTKASTVEVLFPDPAVVLEKADRMAALEVFDPNFCEDADETDGGYVGQITADEPSGCEWPEQAQSGKKPFEIEPSETETKTDEKTAFMSAYVGKLTRRNQILIYNTEKKPMTAIKNIYRRSRAFIEETGVNAVYMAFGFIHWKEDALSEEIYRAPVLLVPIRLQQASAVEPYFLKPEADDILVNPTFSYKINAEYGIKLPEYDDEGLKPYLEKVRCLVSKLQWTVTSECKIGIFSFLKMNMYRDLKDNAAAILKNKNVRLLLGESAGADETGEKAAGAVPVNEAGEKADGAVPAENPLLKLHSVVDADSSQIEAIEMARSGESFVLQGPPGTGKSQTITNIIAECLSAGKKVLFVSEKLAALNVVYDKLRQAGLAEFCLELHSHKANKKAVIAELCHALDAAKYTVSSRADEEIAVKMKAMEQLDAYAGALHWQRPVIEKSLYQLYERYASLAGAPDIEWICPEITSKGPRYLEETTELLKQYAEHIPFVGYDYQKNPWYGCICKDVSMAAKARIRNAFGEAIPFLNALAVLLLELSRKYGIDCDSIEAAGIWRRFFNLAAASEFITPPLLNNERLEMVCAALNELKAKSAELLSLSAQLSGVFDDSIYKLDGGAYYIKLTRQFNRVFSRLFNREYKTIITDIRLCRKDGEKTSYHEAVRWMERLAVYQQKSAAYDEAEAPVKAFIGAGYKGVQTPWDTAFEQISALKDMVCGGMSFGIFADCPDFTSKRDALIRDGDRIENIYASCSKETLEFIQDCFDPEILNIYKARCQELENRLSICLNGMGMLDSWSHFSGLLSELKKRQALPFIDGAIRHNIGTKHLAQAFQKQFYAQWIDAILSGSPALAAFHRVSQDRAVCVFSEKDKKHFEINKSKIRAILSANRPSTDLVASGSALAVLLREGAKKRKQKSIRTLFLETGELVQRLKPCFLMSPLSVSTFLAPDSMHFDVVIFDEASQIFPQDAIGAIYRAGQLIVVGDSRQMPPSNFFNASAVAEADDGDEAVTDFESILDVCQASMKQVRLRWHYRSRCEQLIAFSNKNFYDGRLVTFPSPRADTPGQGVDYYHTDGIFDRKTHTNRKEAEFVVGLIFRNIEKYPERSLGVVAFSVAQQELIEKLLTKQRQRMPEKEYFFNNEKEPFFVKNLETVQGDERDTIIFSVAYGRDAQGRLLHNFGPLNRQGGERRLNVAITRAKYNVQVVCAMHSTDIDLKRTSSDGVRLLREYLDFAENGTLGPVCAAKVRTFEAEDASLEQEVCDFLRARGVAVDRKIGCSGMPIDLGVRRSGMMSAARMPLDMEALGMTEYVLAIECDGENYRALKNARDRDRLRRENLERMGWSFYRIWSTDWFRSKTAEQERLLEAVSEAVKKSEAFSGRPEVSEMESEASQIEPKAKAPEAETKAEAMTLTPEVFEETAGSGQPGFSPYKAANFHEVCRRHGDGDFKAIVKDILEVEAPLSEELLLHRLVWYFGREKVSSAVQRMYEEKMSGCGQYGIVRRNGFLYLEQEKDIQFRIPGDIEREVKHIAPEELAAGMYVILRQNVTVDRSSLYHLMAQQCGVSRAGRAINERFDAALKLLGKLLVIEGAQVSLK